MNFNDFKFKLQRFFRRIHIGGIGAVVCTADLLLELYSFAITLFTNQLNSNNITNIIFLVINCVFDLYLVRYFLQSKENNNLSFAKLAIILLVIANYIMPAISNAIQGILNSSIGMVLFSIILSGGILGIVYFILLVLENKHIGKRNYLIMAILGGIMFLFGIVQGVLNIIMAVETLMVSSDLSAILLFIYAFLSSFVTIGMGLIFFLFPLFTIREQKRGY